MFVAYRFGGWADDGQVAHCADCNSDLAGSVWWQHPQLRVLLAALDEDFPNLSAVWERTDFRQPLTDEVMTLQGDPRLHGGYLAIYREESEP